MEDSFDYFNYVCLMLYPSHFANGFIGYTNPADYPYEIVKYSMDGAIGKEISYYGLQTENANGINTNLSDDVPGKTLAKIRPWLQDFNIGAYYTADMVDKEIKAVTDSTGKDFSGFLLWNPSNIYTKDAVLSSSIIK